MGTCLGIGHNLFHLCLPTHKGKYYMYLRKENILFFESRPYFRSVLLSREANTKSQTFKHFVKKGEKNAVLPSHLTLSVIRIISLAVLT